MPWVRLNITVEGQTERRFADDILTPHLADFEVGVKPRIVVTNRKLGKRGGIRGFESIRQDIIRLLRSDRAPEARFTTMLDLYALPNTFPGWVAAAKLPTPTAKVTALEAALAQDIGDERFIPYIQLHEFETLLYCDLTELARRLSGSAQALGRLTAEVAGLAPEEINEGAATAPSKRIIRHVAAYEDQKVRVGASAAAAIGLIQLRAKCPHFSEWVGKLEALG
ncbi:MAG: DUF4276 family protein [Elusimicrobiota bacterium]|nr:DUF4276 family protein [Elusimicrobiota bacterium]